MIRISRCASHVEKNILIKKISTGLAELISMNSVERCGGVAEKEERINQAVNLLNMKLRMMKMMMI